MTPSSLGRASTALDCLVSAARQATFLVGRGPSRLRRTQGRPTAASGRRLEGRAIVFRQRPRDTLPATGLSTRTIAVSLLAGVAGPACRGLTVEASEAATPTLRRSSVIAGFASSSPCVRAREGRSNCASASGEGRAKVTTGRALRRSSGTAATSSEGRGRRSLSQVGAGTSRRRPGPCAPATSLAATLLRRHVLTVWLSGLVGRGGSKGSGLGRAASTPPTAPSRSKLLPTLGRKGVSLCVAAVAGRRREGGQSRPAAGSPGQGLVCRAICRG